MSFSQKHLGVCICFYLKKISLAILRYFVNSIAIIFALFYANTITIPIPKPLLTPPISTPFIPNYIAILSAFS